MTNFATGRGAWPQHVLAILPFLLFFQLGVIYLGVVIYLISLLLAADYRSRWRNVRENPLFWPVLGMTVVTCAAALLLDRTPHRFGAAFAHYQIYLFLMLFISAGKGAWQARALRSFRYGAFFAATLFYLSAIGLLPKFEFLENYYSYTGNKSILLSILLAIAAAWALHDAISSGLRDRTRTLRYLMAFAYFSGPVLFLSQTRTAVLLLALLCLLACLRGVRWNWRTGVVAAAVLLGAIVAAATMSDYASSRINATYEDLKAYSQGQKPSTNGVRLEIYALTLEIIARKPITGHGIGNWTPLYAELAKERDVLVFATPHNDYLLYAAEMGVFGVAALLWVWLAQLAAAWRMEGSDGMRLLMLGVAIMVGGMFNAVLRDAVFGMAFMILLAIPLAGARSNGARQAAAS